MTATIYTYTPQATPGPTGTDPRPSAGEDALTELCEIDGLRYVSVPDIATVTVPEPLTDWQPASLTDALRAQIKQASPHCRRIDEQLQTKIREKYRLEDELYFARIAVGALQNTYTPTAEEATLLAQYQADVEAIRDWARAERAGLGL